MNAAAPRVADIALPAGLNEPMLRERVRLLAEQSVGAATSVIAGVVLMGVVLAPDVPLPKVAAWIAAYVFVGAWRIAFSRRWLHGTQEATQVALNRFVAFALLNGVLTGALPLLFFHALAPDARMALTVVTLLAASGGTVTFASHPIGYVGYMLLAMPPLIYEWAVNGGERAWIVAATLVVFSVLMVRMSRHLGEVFERSVVIRFEREQVVEQLRREKLETERARQKAEEASRAKSRFLANASHDLRQPAHALGLFTAVLEQSAQTQQHRTIARNIAAASRVLGELLDNLLDMSRLDAGTVPVAPQPVALRAMVERLCEEAARLAADRPIAVSAEAPDLVVMLDPVLTERAVRNLLDNALKFTSHGAVRLVAETRGEWLALTVEDSGCGIAAEQQALVFEEFYQIGNPERDHRRGLGLGLSIVTRLAGLMGGSVKLESRTGEGARFTLLLPLQRVAADSLPALPPPAEAPDLSGWRVLVIDDEVIVRAGMHELLVTWGAEVDEAEGLAGARDIEAIGGQPDWRFCLCDLRLRDGEDGLDTARQLRAEHPAMPIVLVTGDTAPQRIEQASDSGFVLLHKPVTPAHLAQAIRHSMVA